MRVQLEGQALRLRISEAELASLLTGSEVENRTHLPDGRVDVQQLVVGVQSDWQRIEQGWRITLRDADVRALAERLPSRDGLNVALPTPAGDTLEVLFDVDVRDSTRQRLRKG